MMSLSDIRNSVFYQTINGSNKVGAETRGRRLAYISILLIVESKGLKEIYQAM